MNTTLVPATTDTVSIPASSYSDISSRAAGIGAITFAAVVLVQNVIRGASAPANDAAIPDVLRHYADHRGITIVLVATFIVSATALFTFLGGVWRRLQDGPRPGMAAAGLLGAIGVIGLFGVVVGAEQALSVAAGRDTPSESAIDALWSLHNGAFSVLSLSLAVALFGLAKAGVAAGITPAVYERLAPIGAGLLVVSATAGPLIAAGEAMPVFALGGIGFLIWLSFLVATGRRLVRAN